MPLYDLKYAASSSDTPLPSPRALPCTRDPPCPASRRPARQSSVEHTAPYQHISHPATCRVLRDPTRLGLIASTTPEAVDLRPEPLRPLCLLRTTGSGASLGR